MGNVYNMVGGGGGIKLVSIAVITPPTKSRYLSGESFDPAGMVVTATYSNGAKLAGHIAEVYNAPGGKERYWDNIPLEYYAEDYKVMVRECSFDDVVEIDTFRELKALDPTYDI